MKTQDRPRYTKTCEVPNHFRRMLVTAVFCAASTSAALGGDYMYVEGASSAESPSGHVPQRETERLPEFFAKLLGAHQISSGDKLVLLIREYQSGGGVLDADHFMKLSVEIAKVIYGTPIRFDEPGVRAYYSEGGSSWVLKGAGLYASQLHGTIKLTKEGNGNLRAEIDASAPARWADARGPDKPIVIHGNYSLAPLTIDQLTPWLGTPVPSHLWITAASPER